MLKNTRYIKSIFVKKYIYKMTTYQINVILNFSIKVYGYFMHKVHYIMQ